MDDPNGVRELLEACLEGLPADKPAEVSCLIHQRSLSRFANNGIQQNLAREDLTLQLVIQDGDRLGSASTNITSPASLGRLRDKALAAARAGAPQTGLQPLRSSCDTPTCDAADPATRDHRPEAKAEALARTFALAREQGVESSGIFSTSAWELGRANSAGLFCHGRRTEAVFSTTFQTPGASGWAEHSSTAVDRLDPEALSREAADICRRAQHPRPIEAGRYTVVLPPQAVVDFVLYLGWVGLGTRALLDGTSPLSGKQGQAVFGSNLSLREDHGHPLLAAFPFDMEGVARRPVTLIEKGVFRQPVYDLRTAAEAGVESTGHGHSRPNGSGPYPQNLVLEGGDSSLERLIADTPEGLLVTHFHYTNLVDPSTLTLTGMTRDGVFRIRDGQVAEPVYNLRYTVSLFDLFRNIDGLGRTLHLAAKGFGGGAVVPALRVRDFNFSSVSSF